MSKKHDNFVPVKIKARDAEPYVHAIYCSIAGGEPFYNDIVARKPTKDNNKVIWMFESFNFNTYNLDKEVEIFKRINISDYVESNRVSERKKFNGILDASDWYP